jgi:hypothetical protein
MISSLHQILQSYHLIRILSIQNIKLLLCLLFLSLIEKQEMYFFFILVIARFGKYLKFGMRRNSKSNKKESSIHKKQIEKKDNSISKLRKVEREKSPFVRREKNKKRRKKPGHQIIQ